MKIDLNKAISLAIIIFGYVFFLFYISIHAPIAFIALISMFLLWIVWNKMIGSFILNHLIYLLLISGILISISILIVYGIEPIGTRNGTLVRFHSTYIAVAITLFFLTLLPYIIFNMKIELPIKTNKIRLMPDFTKKQNKTKQKKDQYIIHDNNWEIASESDALSGHYDID